MLEHANFAVVEAKDGVEALELVKQSLPDLVILDVMMPGIDGLTVCQRLRSDEATADLPIIMLSARTQPDAIEAGLRAGATMYLTKPVSRKELIQHMHEVLNQVASSPSR
jgi:DNA-binding response OmpR family regulator